MSESHIRDALADDIHKGVTEAGGRCSDMGDGSPLCFEVADYLMEIGWRPPRANPDPSEPWPIPLPPEPPRDRVIEAVWAPDGTVEMRYTHDGGCWRNQHGDSRGWGGIIYSAMGTGRSLRSVPAESGAE